MKKVLVILVFMSYFDTWLFAQKNDYQWMFGYGNVGPPDTNFGGVILYFDSNPVQVLKHIRLADFDDCNVSFCDNNGSLLFYSNCGDVFDRRDSIMLNGDSINFGTDWENNVLDFQRYFGMSIPQGMLALPWPADSTKVYLVHHIVDYVTPPNTYADYLADTSFFTIVDLNGNGGFGRVTVKNQLLCTDTLAYAMLSAVRHGNGRDWWIIHPHYIGNCYYIFLLTDTGIGLNQIQCIGQDLIYHGALPTSCFSPDGGHYFWVDALDGIRMFDFDRCTGLLNNPQIIPFPFASFGDSVVYASGIAVSPDNRFLYILANFIALQYDLQATDIGASVDTVAIWDGTYDPFSPYATTFFWAQIGPDGKIYINSPNSVKSLSVINSPDSPGDSCLFLQHSLHLNTLNLRSLPNFPNYRLGPLAGSACDTLSTATEDVRAIKEKVIKVFPNPAADIVTIDYGFTDWSKGPVSLQISNAWGQTVYTQNLPMYSGYQKIDVSGFASGFYNVAIVRNNGVVGIAKLIKQ